MLNSHPTFFPKPIFMKISHFLEEKIKYFQEIQDQAASYKNGTKTCNLCLAEKFHIITSKQRLHVFVPFLYDAA